ncbi:MAG: ATP-dependent Clp protease ATP-binding subunit, partial [Clostridia bacterium]
MLCTKCKKRMAVVFMTRMEGEKTINEGLCLKCAKELGIKPVDDMMKQMGISDEELENMEEQLQELTSGENLEGFDLGGAQTSNFIQNFLGKLGNKADEPMDGAIIPIDDNKKHEKNTNQKSSSKKPVKERKFLNAYCEDLTKKAADGKIDNIIGRDQEIYRVIQILNRRTKNNPCLIGEPGVGKTAIAEGIALKIVNGDVPAKIAEKEIFLLDLTALVAGT